jgi:hypothetical protein
MAKDRFDTFGSMLSKIGGALAEMVDGDPDGIFLYVEIGAGWIGPSAFRDEGEVVHYLRCDDETLLDLLWEAWRAEPEGQRWSVMEYDVKGREFAVAFKYPDEVDVEVMDEAREDAALRARFGDKKIVYPPMPEGAFEWKP